MTYSKVLTKGWSLIFSISISMSIGILLVLINGDGITIAEIGWFIIIDTILLGSLIALKFAIDEDNEHTIPKEN